MLPMLSIARQLGSVSQPGGAVGIKGNVYERSLNNIEIIRKTLCYIK